MMKPRVSYVLIRAGDAVCWVTVITPGKTQVMSSVDDAEAV